MADSDTDAMSPHDSARTAEPSGTDSENRAAKSNTASAPPIFVMSEDPPLLTDSASATTSPAQVGAPRVGAFRRYIDGDLATESVLTSSAPAPPEWSYRPEPQSQTVSNRPTGVPIGKEQKPRPPRSTDRVRPRKRRLSTGLVTVAAISLAAQAVGAMLVILLLNQFYEFYWRTFYPVSPDAQLVFLGAKGAMVVAVIITAVGVLSAMMSGNRGILSVTAVLAAVCNCGDLLFVFLILDLWKDRPIGYIVNGSLLALAFFAAAGATVSMVVMFFVSLKG